MREWVFVESDLAELFFNIVCTTHNNTQINCLSRRKIANQLVSGGQKFRSIYIPQTDVRVEILRISFKTRNDYVLFYSQMNPR